MVPLWSSLSISASMVSAHFLLSGYRAACAREAGGGVVDLICFGIGVRYVSARRVSIAICTLGMMTLAGSLKLKCDRKSTALNRLTSWSLVSVNMYITPSRRKYIIHCPLSSLLRLCCVIMGTTSCCTNIFKPRDPQVFHTTVHMIISPLPSVGANCICPPYQQGHMSNMSSLISLF